MWIFLFVVTVLVSPAAAVADAKLLKFTRDGAFVELRFEAPEYTLTDVVVNGEVHAAIELKNASGMGVTMTKGFPELPYFTESIAIPGTAAMGLEIVSQTVQERSVNTIVPSKGSLSRAIDPSTVPYTFDSIYTKDEWYPRHTVTLGEPYVINGVRGLAVTCYPFQYNPKSGLLRIAASMVVRIKRTGTSAVNVFSDNTKIILPAFDRLYSRHFINFDSLRSNFAYLPDADKMLVIAAPSLKDAVQPLVDWKNQKGIATTMYEYPAETGGAGPTALATFIKGIYDSEKISYILLVGDYSAIPTQHVGGILSDVAYTKLRGDDDYPDVFIGRFYSSSASEISALAAMTINYEKSPDSTGNKRQKGVYMESDIPGNWTNIDKGWMGDHRIVLDRHGDKAVETNNVLVFWGSYIPQPWTEPQWAIAEMSGQFTVDEQWLSVGSLFYSAECKMLDIGKGSDEVKKTYLAWMYFGDPSVMHFTQQPKVLTVTPPASLGKGNQSVTVTFDEAATGRVALFDTIKKRLLGSTLATNTASAAFPALIPDDAQSVILTVTAFNRVTFIQEVPILTSSSIIDTTYWAGVQNPIK